MVYGPSKRDIHNCENAYWQLNEKYNNIDALIILLKNRQYQLMPTAGAPRP
jgi:hypothetical protein